MRAVRSLRTSRSAIIRLGGNDSGILASIPSHASEHLARITGPILPATLRTITTITVASATPMMVRLTAVTPSIARHKNTRHCRRPVGSKVSRLATPPFQHWPSPGPSVLSPAGCRSTPGEDAVHKAHAKGTRARVRPVRDRAAARENAPEREALGPDRHSSSDRRSARYRRPRRPDNPAARDLYLSVGFEPAKQTDVLSLSS